MPPCRERDTSTALAPEVPARTGSVDCCRPSAGSARTASSRVTMVAPSWGVRGPGTLATRQDRDRAERIEPSVVPTLVRDCQSFGVWGRIRRLACLVPSFSSRTPRPAWTPAPGLICRLLRRRHRDRLGGRARTRLRPRRQQEAGGLGRGRPARGPGPQRQVRLRQHHVGWHHPYGRHRHRRSRRSPACTPVASRSPTNFPDTAPTPHRVHVIRYAHRLESEDISPVREPRALLPSTATRLTGAPTLPTTAPGSWRGMRPGVLSVPGGRSR